MLQNGFENRLVQMGVKPRAGKVQMKIETGMGLAGAKTDPSSLRGKPSLI